MLLILTLEGLVAVLAGACEFTAETSHNHPGDSFSNAMQEAGAMNPKSEIMERIPL